MIRRTRSETEPGTSRRRDDGITLVEVVIGIALTAIVLGAVFTAIVVITRTQSVVTRSISESNDVVRVTNLLPSDVQAGPLDIDAYAIASDGSSGTRCAATGSSNVLRIQGSNAAVAFHLTKMTETARLDRIVCASDGSVLSVSKLADSLDGSLASPVEVQITRRSDDPGDDNYNIVERIEVTMRFESGNAEVVSASPRAEPELVSGGGGQPVCVNGNPTAAALGFGSLSEGSARLVGNTQAYQGTGTNEALSWSGGVVQVGQNSNSAADYPSISPSSTALYVSSIDWANSSGTLRVLSNSNVVIVDSSNVQLNAQRNRATAADGSSSAILEVQGSGKIVDFLPEYAIDFDTMFDDLRACSVALASLPNGCGSCATHVVLTDQNGNLPFPGVNRGQGQAVVRLQRNKANVLNLTAQSLDALPNLVFVWDDAPNNRIAPNPSSPLVINVVDGGSVTLTSLPQLSGAGGLANSVIYNFVNAEQLTLGPGGDGVWGTVFAPNTDVHIRSKVEGRVVARTAINQGVVINNSRGFDGMITWE